MEKKSTMEKMVNFWNGRKVFVTGGTGFLGSHLVEILKEKGALVVCLVRDFVPDSLFFSKRLHNKVTIVRGSIEDYELMLRVINEYEIETVFHLAAQAIVGTANRSPLSTFETNIKGTWCILEACRQSPLVKRIVIASSDKAYGSQEKLPYDEKTPLQGEHPYDVSKSCSDLLAQSYYKTYKLPVAITRCGNFYGPGDLNVNRIIPGTIKSIIEKKSPIIRSDGTFIRDYLYVLDGVDAYLTTAENLDRKEIQGEAFNFSTANKISVLELVNLTLKIMGSTLKPTILNQAHGEIKHQYLDSGKAKSLLSWKAKFSIEQGLIPTIAWYKETLQ